MTSLAVRAILAFALVALVLGASLPGTTAWMRVLNNSAHGPVFAVLAWLLLGAIRVYPRTRVLPPLQQYVAAFGAATALGVITEAMQFIGPRDASLGDLALDMLGAGAMLCLLAAFDPVMTPPGRERRKQACLAAGMAGILILSAPVAVTAAAYVNRNRQFPVLVNADSLLDLYFVRGTRAQLQRIDDPAVPGGQTAPDVLQVTFRPGRWPGLRIAEPVPDWSGYTVLAMDLDNPDPAPLELVLQVRPLNFLGRRRDGPGYAVTVPAGERRTVRVALEDVQALDPRGELRLDAVGSMDLFRADLPDGASPPGGFVLRAMWLE